jgi:alpha-ketoglutarate-dependent taurine dioxygenase
MTFGLFLEKHPSNYSSDELRTYLSNSGVIVFRGHQLSDLELNSTMEKVGKVQDSKQQQAPQSATDKNLNTIIHLHNEDFLGKSRMGWHMDQTYLKTLYMPVRSLYCSEVDSTNTTEFADINFLSIKVLEKWPQLINSSANYYIDSAKTIFNYRKIFSFCKHVNKDLLRYDNRLEFTDGTDSLLFKNFCRDHLNGNEIPKISITWQPYDFVIFDNNQSPHRRSEMNGVCKLKRLTSYFWITP